MVKRKKKAAASSGGKKGKVMDDETQNEAEADGGGAAAPPKWLSTRGQPDWPRAGVTHGFERYVPAPEEIAQMQKYFIDRRDELMRQVAEIEAMIGFVVQSGDLAVRVAKIEQFLGIKA